ncbi:hypothetical protein [Bacillus sp. FJAT-29814]|uniref:hypothetical protein n=1 Tax=Bacillus sp. FJAT-29814 TaxID=1729688 RepID=UPI00082F0D26|nr:hypothetical protein [Bacillus sp. FJAT-29814]
MTDLTRTAIKILNKLYFHPEKQDEWLAVATTELVIDIGLFNNVDEMAYLIYHEEAYGLLEKLKLFDAKLVWDIEMKLKEV